MWYLDGPHITPSHKAWINPCESCSQAGANARHQQVPWQNRSHSFIYHSAIVLVSCLRIVQRSVTLASKTFLNRFMQRRSTVSLLVSSLASTCSDTAVHKNSVFPLPLFPFFLSFRVAPRLRVLGSRARPGHTAAVPAPPPAPEEHSAELSLWGLSREGQIEIYWPAS